MNKPMKIKCLIAVVLSMFFLSNVSAQVQWDIYSSINTGSNALASNKIRSIQKVGNTMVFTHVGGVSFFDGNSWSGMITSKINQNEIRDFVKTSNGKMYIPTVWNGIYEIWGSNYLNTTTDFVLYNTYNSSIPTNNFLCAEEDKQNRVWFGSQGKGIVIKDDTNFINYRTTNSGLLNDTVYDIVFYNYKAYIGTERGISIRDSAGTWLNLPYNNGTTSNGLSNPSCLDLFLDDNHSLWVGTYWGLNKLVGDTAFISFTTQNGLLNNHIKNITQDNSGNIWCACINGLSKFDLLGFTNYTSTGSIATLPHGDINYIEFDNNNNLWVGTEEHGVMRYNGNLWSVFNTSDGLPFSAFVTSIGKDSHGSLWFSSDQDYYLSSDMAYGKLHNGSFSSLTPTTATGEKIGLRGVGQLLDVNGRHWISTLDKGVAIETNGSWQIKTPQNSFLPSSYCISLANGSNGDVWVGTNKGLVKFNSQLNITAYDTSNSNIADNYVYDVVRDYSGNIWAATANGLSKFNGTSWVTYDSSNYNISDNSVYRLIVDKDSNLWVSIYGSGLLKYNGTNWIKYNMSNSNLPSNYFIDLIIDNNGDLVACSSNHGISKLLNGNWINYADYQHTKYGSNPNGYNTVFQDSTGAYLCGDWDFGLAKLSLCSNFNQQISILGDSAICQGDSTILQANNTSGLTYSWYKNHTKIIGQNNGSLTVSTSGSYYAVITDTIYGCVTSTTPKSIVVYPNIFNLKFTANDSILIAPPFNVTFQNQTPNLSNYSFDWSFGDGITSTYYNPFHQYLYNGSYSVKMRATNNATGCVNEIIKPNYILTSGGSSCNVTASISPSGTSTICNNDSLLLTANSGVSYTYQWVKDGIIIAGANSINYYAKNSGYYAVVVANNLCSAISQPFVLTHYPAITPQISSSGIIMPCTNDSTKLSLSAFYTAYQWSTGETTPSIWVKSTGYYFVKVTDQFGCMQTSQQFQLNNSYLLPPEICIIGVDSATGKNRIIWERQNTNLIDSIVILRENTIAGVYDKIGAISYQQAGIYIDTFADPSVRAWRYKIAAIDTCGAQSLNSPLHKTIHLTINAGLNGTWNLIWNNYKGFNPPSYYIYRGTSSSNTQLLAQIPGNLNSFTDLNPPTGTVHYQIEIVKNDGCYPDSLMAKANTNYNTSRSNTANNGSINPIFLQANFNGNITTGQWPVQVNFTDISTGMPNSWLWQFGDGNSSIEQNPSHTYNNSGLFTISLKVCNGNICDTTIKQNYINVLPNGMVEILSQPQLFVYPNPANGIFNLSVSNYSFGKMNISVFSNVGQMLYNNEVEIHRELNTSLNLNYLPKGIYYLYMVDEKGFSFHRKLIIN